MSLEWGSDAAKKFVTNVGLITSDGPHGPNIMSAEWTHHISYSPGLIMINVHDADATADNIKASKEFGVNLCATGQNVVSSISGGSSGRDVNKIAVLKELGVRFYKAKKIGVLMIKDAVLNVECKLVKSLPLGDHMMFVGEALDVSASDKQPLVYHDNKYWKVGDQLKKPPQKELNRIAKLIEKHKK